MPSGGGGVREAGRARRVKGNEGSRAGAKLRVRQVRSGIGRPALHRRTLQAIGLRHHQDVVDVRDTPQMRGMLFQVRHLVEVTPVEG
jgi:large subunit ribosomal protein L30